MARVVRAPHVAGVPAALRGSCLVVVDVAITAEPGVAAEELLAGQVARTGVHAIGEHLMLRELPAVTVDAFIASAGQGSATPLVSAELRHLGGAEAERVRIGLERKGSGSRAARPRGPGFRPSGELRGLTAAESPLGVCAGWKRRISPPATRRCDVIRA